MRWLRPMPVRPAITAGTHPPDGVTETTQPSSSAASMDVVSAVKASMYCCSSGDFGLGPPSVRHFSRSAVNGLVPPWNG